VNEEALSVDAQRLESALVEACAEGVGPNMRRWLSFIGASPGDVVELQALDVPARRGAPVSLYAHATSSDAVEDLLRRAARWDMSAPGLYQIVNRLDARVAARSTPNEWHRAGRGSGSSDRDVTHRLVLPIDLDVIRPKGTSTSAEEMQRSVVTASAVLERLRGYGIPEASIAYGHSGNGRWLALGLDAIEETPDVREFVRGILAALDRLHSTDEVKIDASLSDAKRLGPAWGTMKRKGAHTPDRPHRATGIVTPKAACPLTLTDLHALHDRLVADAPATPTLRAIPGGKSKTRRPAARRETDAPSSSGLFEVANSVPALDVAEHLGLADGGQLRCPRGCSGGTSVVILERPNLLKCSHDTCADVGPRGGGVRTPVDLWAEVQGLEPQAAARAICTWRGLTPAKVTKAKRRRQELREAPPPASEDQELLEIEMDVARMLVDVYGDRLRYIQDIGYLVWTGAYWARDNLEAARELVKDVVTRLREDAKRWQDKDLEKLVKRVGSAKGVSAVLDLARSDPRVRIEATELDANPHLITVRNGTIDLRTGELRDHDPEDLITRHAPTVYDPDAKFDVFDRVLEHLVPDPEAREYLQRAIGYSLSGVCSEDILLLLVGPPRSGKSTLLRAMRETLGDLYAETEMKSWCVDERASPGADKARSDLFRLLGRRIVAASEIHSGMKFDTGRLKAVAGGEMMAVRPLYKDAIEAPVTFTLWLVANDGDLPDLRSDDGALWERIRRIPVGSTIPEEERDPAIREGMGSSAARMAVLAWAVRGAVAWYERGLGVPPESIREASEALRGEMDPLGHFANELLEFNPYAKEAKSSIKEALEEWMDGRPPSAKRLARALADHGARHGVEVRATTVRVEGKKNPVRAWQGVRLLTPEERVARMTQRASEEPSSPVYTSTISTQASTKASTEKAHVVSSTCDASTPLVDAVDVDSPESPSRACVREESSGRSVSRSVSRLHDPDAAPDPADGPLPDDSEPLPDGALDFDPATLEAPPTTPSSAPQPRASDLPPPRQVTDEELAQLPSYARPQQGANPTTVQRWERRVRELLAESPLMSLTAAGLKARGEIQTGGRW